MISWALQASCCQADQLMYVLFLQHLKVYFFEGNTYTLCSLFHAITEAYWSICSGNSSNASILFGIHEPPFPPKPRN